jgi:hypothetical protein
MSKPIMLLMEITPHYRPHHEDNFLMIFLMESTPLYRSPAMAASDPHPVSADNKPTSHQSIDMKMHINVLEILYFKLVLFNFRLLP